MATKKPGLPLAGRSAHLVRPFDRALWASLTAAQRRKVHSFAAGVASVASESDDEAKQPDPMPVLEQAGLALQKSAFMFEAIRDVLGAMNHSDVGLWQACLACIDQALDQVEPALDQVETVLPGLAETRLMPRS